MNVLDLLHNTALSVPDAIALIDEKGSLPYRDLLESVRTLQEKLRSQLTEGTHRVGLKAKNGREFLIGLFAIVGAGHIAAPLGWNLKGSEDLAHCRDLGLSTVLSSRSLFWSSKNNPFKKAEVKLDEEFLLHQIESSSPDTPREISNPAFIRPTSGTTGKSKGVVLSHRSVIERVNIAQENIPLSPNDRIVWVLPMAYHFIVSLMHYISRGSTIIVARDHMPDTLIQGVVEHQASILYASPMHYALLSESPDRADFSGLRYAICTSQKITSEVAEKFESRFHCPLRQVFGMIEAGLPIGNLSSPPAPIESVGKPLKGFSVAILGSEGNSLPRGETGELGISGPGVFDGYLEPPSSSDAFLQNGWLLTGDLAYQDDAENIFIVGRKKSVIIVSGNKVFPEEVEAVLNSHPEIEGSRVFGVKHSIFGETLHAEILPKEITLDLDSIKKFARSQLAPFKVPEAFFLVRELPLTRTGKVVRFTPSSSDRPHLQRVG